MNRETGTMRCARCGGEKTGTHAGYCRACYNAYKREWYKRNREAEILRCDAWNRAHPERVAANMRKVRAKDPGAARAKNNAWRAANPDRVRVYDANKRAKRRSPLQVAGCLTRAEWEAIKVRQGGKCFYCFRVVKLTMDHVKPLARGGEHRAANVVGACLSCNASKHTKPATEFIVERLSQGFAP